MATDEPTAEVSAMPKPGVRALVSALVIFHVAAVFIGPFAMPPQNSELGAKLAGWLQPYLDILSLGNGYRFFAPEPGPSHLVRYEITLDDGTLKTGAFPDRDEHQPRLLYHRYFMLTEFVNSLGGPEPNERAQAYAKAYAEHLAYEHDAKSVKLFLRRHFVPRTEEVRQGMRLTNPALYVEDPLYTLNQKD